jgi:hypothetical protein
MAKPSRMAKRTTKGTISQRSVLTMAAWPRKGRIPWIEHGGDDEDDLGRVAEGRSPPW